MDILTPMKSHEIEFTTFYTTFIEKFIASYFILNPVIYFQNKINAITKTDYYAYKGYRDKIQSIIDKKVDFILLDTWNKVEVDKQKYIHYLNAFNN